MDTNARTVAWIFLAIDFTDLERAWLTDILHAADAINHAVPLERELKSSIQFLTSHGMIIKTGKSFRVTELGRDMLKSAHDGAANVFGVWRALEAQIASLGAA
ncbi:hypothetical protein [Lysobacter sp. P5_B9]